MATHRFHIEFDIIFLCLVTCVSYYSMIIFAERIYSCFVAKVLRGVTSHVVQNRGSLKKFTTTKTEKRENSFFFVVSSESIFF